MVRDVRPFHIAFPVRDKEEARHFYGDVLCCEIGRESDTWIDFSLYDHQISAHVREGWYGGAANSKVDGDAVPVPHFGVILAMAQWQALAGRLEDLGDAIKWVMRPKVRFMGEPGEQATLFILDPSGNALEFKGFRSDDAIFVT